MKDMGFETILERAQKEKTKALVFTGNKKYSYFIDRLLELGEVRREKPNRYVLPNGSWIQIAVNVKTLPETYNYAGYEVDAIYIDEITDMDHQALEYLSTLIRSSGGEAKDE